MDQSRRALTTQLNTKTNKFNDRRKWQPTAQPEQHN